MLSLIFLLLASPLPEPEPVTCVTYCGLKLIIRTNTCKQAQALELKVLRAVAKGVTQFTSDDVCEAERDWVVITHTYTKKDGESCPWPSWGQGNVPCVIGYTHRELNVIETQDENWLHNALAHELMHVTQIHKFHGDGHCNWKKLGIKKVLKDVTGEADTSEPEAECKYVDAGVLDVAD